MAQSPQTLSPAGHLGQEVCLNVITASYQVQHMSGTPGPYEGLYLLSLPTPDPLGPQGQSVPWAVSLPGDGILSLLPTFPSLAVFSLF